MTTRKNTFLLKRSNVPGKVPSPGDLQLGELALNTSDVILYASGTTANQMLPIGWDRLSTLSGGTVNGNVKSTGYFSGTTYYGDGSNLTGISDYYVTGGTYSSGTLTLNRQNGSVTITGFTTGNGTTFTGGTVSGPTNFISGLTANTIYTDYIDFNTGTTATNQLARLKWNDSDEIGGLEVTMKGGNVTLQIGEENMARVYNDDTVTLTKGMVVYVYSSQGNTISVKLASATGETTSSKTLGVVNETIPVGGRGFVNTFGLVRDLDTSAYSGGTALWLGTTPGTFTNIKPNAPNHNVLIGFVSRVSATVGSIFIHISNGWELDELHDVAISNITTGDLLSYSGNVWINTKTLNGSYTITGDTTIGGNLVVSGNSGVNWFSSNTSSDLVRITQTGSGNAFVVEDDVNPDSTPFVINSNGKVGIGTTTPSNVNLDIVTSGISAGTAAALRIRESSSSSQFNITAFSGSTNGKFLRLSEDTTGNAVMVWTQGGYVGIGTPNVSYRLDMVGSQGKFYNDLDTTGFTQSVLSGNSSGLTTMQVTAPSVGAVGFGVRGLNDSTYAAYGKVGDSFFYSSIVNNGINLVSAPGSGTDDYIRFYAGQTASGTTPDIHIQGSGSTRGNVGIGTASPSVKLDVNGNVNLNSSYLLWAYDGANNNDYIISNDIPHGGSSNPSGFFVFKHDSSLSSLSGTGVSTLDAGSIWLNRSSEINYIAGSVGIGTTSPSTKLHIVNDTGLRVARTGSSVQYIDINQNVVGVGNPAITSYSDPANAKNLYIGATTTTGNTSPSAGNVGIVFTTLGNTAMYIDSNQNVGIGTGTPPSRLTVVTSAGTTGSYPAISGTTQTGDITRLRNGGSNLVFDIGGFSSNGNWLQSTNQTDLSLTYPLLLNPNGGKVGVNLTTPSESLHVSGNTIVSGTISGGTMVITNQPTSGYTTTQILMRNSTSGQVEITDSTSPSIYNYGMSYAMTTFNYLT